MGECIEEALATTEPRPPHPLPPGERVRERGKVGGKRLEVKGKTLKNKN